ncbi:MAG: branched-chain amino acid transporter AzlD [Clostridiales bacterium]|jgi:branched-subunit amino acid transport protein AzlD|nr:branched-chain amino acid transporter AzlD [Clostridiales bacterium]
MSDIYIITAIAAAALATMFDRALPYMLFSGKKELPERASYLGNSLPTAIMAILVVYCLRNIDFSVFPHGLAEFISVLLVAFLQIWKNNTVVSIILGTACYMVLIRTVF